MNIYYLSGEQRCTIQGKTLFTSLRNHKIEASTEKEAIEKFKEMKKGVKKVKAVLANA